MDPLTILALAKGSYEAIKTGVKLGKEVQSLFRDISNLMDSASKLTKLAADPPKPKLFGKESAGVPTAIADACHARVRLPMRPQVRSMNMAMSAALALGEALRQTATLPG